MVLTPFRNSYSDFIDKGYIASIYVIALTLPIRPFFLHNILSYSTILFLIFALAKIIYSKEFSLRKNLNSILLFCSLFIWWAIGLLYSENTDLAFKYLGTKLALFLIPLFLLLIDPISEIQIKKVLKAYALGITFYMLVNYFLIVIQNYNYNQFEHVILPFYMYHSLVHYIGMHASYMAIQVALSIIIALNIVLNSSYKRKTVLAIHIVWISFLIFVLISLTVKMVSLAFFTAIIFFIIFKIGFKSSLKVFVPIVAIILLSILFFSDHHWFKKRLGNSENITVQDLSMDPENKEGKWGSINMRYALAKTSLEVIKENPVFGVGIGDEKEERNKVYNESGFYFALNKGFNEHNQYLNTLLSSGMIGLSVLLIVLIIPFSKAWRNKDALYIAFLILIIISFLSENYLSRQTGVMFFAFFHSILWQRLSFGSKTIQ